MEQNTFNLFNSMGSPAAHLLKGLDCVTSENKRRRASGRHTPRRKSQEKRKKGEKERCRGERAGSRSGAYVEDDFNDRYRSPPPRSSDKKLSCHKMEEEIRMREVEAQAQERAKAARPKEVPLAEKWDEHKDHAAKYREAAHRC